MNIDDFAGRLDGDELALAVHIHVVNRPLAEAAIALGWTTFRTRRAYERLQRKLKRAASQVALPARTMDEAPPRNSLPHFLERLESGRRVWAMRPTSDMYLDMVVNALPSGEISYVHENKPNAYIQNIVKARISAMEVVTVNLEQDLASAKENLTRIQQQRADAQRNLTILTATYADAQAADRKASEDEILEGRTPDKKRGRQLDALKVELMEAETGLEVLARAIERAQANVDAIAGEINNRQLEILRVKFQPGAIKLESAAEVAADMASTIRKTLAEVGQANLEEILFPIKNAGAADYRTLQERRAYMNFFNSAFALLNIRETGLKLYDRKAEAA